MKDDAEGIGDDRVTLKVVTATEALDLLSNYIQGLPGESFTKPAIQRKNALANKISALKKIIELKGYQEAIEKLRSDIRAKADGFVGGNPSNDWITEAAAQKEICKMTDDLMAYLDLLKSRSAISSQPTQKTIAALRDSRVQRIQELKDQGAEKVRELQEFGAQRIATAQSKRAQLAGHE